ncbi:LysR family transcriptional regulator [Pseudaminobacter salicylatoxidans]|uniref:LysR family transcriptional regulator n=1 Tax=Pseudaminobacter salicylatoxidans TaxID=93369 RepID=UPI000474F07E|nr:LysR family transcriptional regulator [Pseudaminobacter salicylatoxidans]
MRVDHISLLPVFRMVATSGGFTAAAGPLGVTPSAVSQKIRQLEAMLGVRLFERTSRSVRLTEAGRLLLADTERPFEELAAAIDHARTIDQRPAGILRINLSRLAAEVCILPRLGNFVRRYPEITLELSTDDRLTNIVASGFDAGIRMSGTLEQDMIARRIGPPLRRAMLAAPSYLDRCGVPLHPRELDEHEVIRYRFPGSQRLEPLTFRIGDQVHRLDPTPRLILDDNGHIALAVREGLGLAQRYRVTEEAAIKSGEVVEVLSEFEPEPFQFHLYYPSRNQPPKLQVFIRWFVD